jgi:hypothetical protein
MTMSRPPHSRSTGPTDDPHRWKCLYSKAFLSADPLERPFSNGPPACRGWARRPRREESCLTQAQVHFRGSTRLAKYCRFASEMPIFEVFLHELVFCQPALCWQSTRQSDRSFSVHPCPWRRRLPIRFGGNLTPRSAPAVVGTPGYSLNTNSLVFNSAQRMFS